MWAPGPRRPIDTRRRATDYSVVRSGAYTVDHALRVLATGCAERRRPIPAAGAVVLGPASVLLRLTTPDEAPPAGWTVQDHGQTWLSPLQWLRTAAADDRIAAPYPLLVSAGLTGEERLLLNLAQAGGLIGVEGDLELARLLVRSWSRRLSTSPWATTIQVIRVGFPPDPGFAGWNVARPAEAAPALENPAGGILFLADRPTGRDLHQVDRRRWTVVAVGAQDATWRFTVGADGTMDTGLVAAPVLLCA